MKHRIQTAYEEHKQWYFVEQIDEAKPCAKWERLIGSSRLTLAGTKEWLTEHLTPIPELDAENETLAKEIY